MIAWEWGWVGAGRRIYKGRDKTFGGDGDLYYLNHGHDFAGVYKCQIYQIMLFKYMQIIIGHLYLSKAVKMWRGKK